MTHVLDLNRLSSFVGAIADRKIKTVSMSITGSTGYLRNLATQAQGYASEALGYSSLASGYATDANTAASSALIVWNNFTSTYVGTATSDPVISSQGNSINRSAIYIRESDGRLRYVTGFGIGGEPLWADATVTADLSSLAGAGSGVFLSLNATTSQIVKGPITFQNSVITPRVVSWTSQQTATAIDVNERILAVQSALTTETNRAIAAETAVGTGRVAKTGDTMSGALSIIATGDTASLTVRNSTPTTGKNYRLNATNDGRLRFVDDSTTTERMSIRADGVVVVNSSLTVGNSITSTGNIVSNRVDGNDPIVALQSNTVTRWLVGRSVASTKFYIARLNNTGVYIDSPIQINETDGLVTLNKTVINDTLQTKGSVRVDSVSPTLLLNNTSGIADSAVVLQHLGTSRWLIGRSASEGTLNITRYSNVGGLVDVPLKINETNGWTTVTNIQSTGVANAAVSVTTPIVYTTATNTGRNVAIGDDAWIGDSNIINGISIRGQSDFNAGFLRFGNSSATLGCTPNDSDLKYGGNKVVHAGNIAAFWESGSNANGYWERSPTGRYEMWGKKIGTLTQGWHQVDLPQSFTNIDSMNISLTPMNSSGGTSANFDILVQYKNHELNSFVFIVQDTNGGALSGCMWKIIGY